MEHHHGASKSQVQLALNEDVVRQAQLLTADLSGTVEELLIRFIDRASKDEAERQRRIDRHIDASNAFLNRHGTLADEFSAL